MVYLTNKVIQLDMENLYNRKYIDISKLNNTTILITGANGMLATYLIHYFMYLNIEKKYNIRVVALARNNDKANERFNEYINNAYFELIIQDVCNNISYFNKVDYIIHAAGSASPKYIINDPISIIQANTKGTLSISEFGVEKNVKKVLFTSTREIYGKIDKELITESDMGILDPLDPRSCYPESKRISENILLSYHIQKKLPFSIARIAHSYGPGMDISDDGRVMSDLISDVVNNRNIILNSDGTAKRSFCYLTDAIAGILTILIHGRDTEAYNLANETEEISIKALAELLIKLFPEKNIDLQYKQLNETQKTGYVSFKRVQLSTHKLEALGWKPMIKLEEGLKNTVQSFDIIH